MVGSEKHVIDIINNINYKKYELYLIMSKGNTMIDGVNVDKLKGLYYINRNNPICLLKMSKIIKEIKPNIIHAHAARAIFYSRLLYKKNKRKIKDMKLICTAHGWILEYLKFNRILQKMFLMNRKLDSITLTVSKHSMNELAQKGYEQKKLRYIYNGIDVESYNKNAKIKTSVKNIAYIGRFTNQKGITYLMRTIKMLKDSQYQFDIYGKGELKSYIEENIKDLENVQLHDFIPANKVKDVLYNTDVLILPSIDEGFPYILVEAISCGVPCIATNVGGVKEIIDENVGFLIPSKDEKELYNAIVEINQKNIEKLSRNCIEKSQKFSINVMINEIEKIYEEVLNG